jgi:hypothetical protein
MDTAQSDQVYRSDKHRAPDADFEPGALRHLVAGRPGRLLDPRRTPVRVTALDLDRGYFEVEIQAFEDAGARWLVPMESVHNYQFAGGPDVPREALEAMREVVARFNRPLVVPADPDARARSLRRLGEERARARQWLDDAGVAPVELDLLIRGRSGDPERYQLLARYLDAQDVAEIETGFASTYVSGPGSGELVKGHAIVLAELGLCPFEGTVIRDPALFAGAWTKERRARHLLARMGFVQALLTLSGPAEAPVYRGFSVEGTFGPRHVSSFVSATFSADVANAHFGARDPKASTAALLRQPLPIDRVFMTFVETAEMNDRYREAEAVLIGDPESRTF